MDVREKLIDLIIDAKRTDPEAGSFTEYLADCLINNGVTVQEWVSVDDRLPESEQYVILCTRETETYGKHHEKKKIYRNIYMGYFDGNEWLTIYCYGSEYIFRMNKKYPNETIEVTHWMPLPPLPKGWNMQ